MSVLSFFTSLNKNFERSRILEDIAFQRDYITETLLPSLKRVQETYGSRHFTSARGMAFEVNAASGLAAAKSKGAAKGLYDYFSGVVGLLSKLEALVPELFAADVTKETMTYQKTALLQLLESLRFLEQYALTSLSVALTSEVAKLLGKDEAEALADRFTKAELEYYTSEAGRYVNTLKALDRPIAQIEGLILKAANMTIDEKRNATVQQTVGLQATDPLQLGFLSPSTSPIYWLRSWITEFQHTQYKAGIEEARLLELKILELKQALENKEDARTQKALEYTEGRLSKLKGQLADYEERAS